ncbi:S-adenosyl-L-methionine-dependent methyltransferase [Phyllosticta capitalensis]|uniref:S-adenosyl-L-methionine-dependent methyltransferase n=1 Tax=Phyllosticta capitalensis TaxID=121624 RepID=A0ABR1Y9N7_9PEZI
MFTKATPQLLPRLPFSIRTVVMARGRGGRGGGRGRGRGGGRGGRGGGYSNNGRSDWKDIEKKNEHFEKYYNELNIVPEEEREVFWSALKKELPNSFRFTGSKGHALAVQKRLIEHYIPEITDVTFEGKPVPPPTQIEWFPEKLAWQMTTPKNVIRKFPPFASFQKFLVSETTVGNISRQEIVSMIPPLLMNIKPWMTVLDLCAAPGSKSAQLAEAIHLGEEVRVRKALRKLAPELKRELSPDGAEEEAEKDLADEGDDSDYGRSTGLLVANDVDNKRAHMLVHQVKRLNSPNLIVTNHDATLFPSIRIPSPAGQPAKYLKFDRILADVPCSGDGTARKNFNVWKDWTAGNGLGLYITQQRILVRALQLLKVGGRVVYSTCSMNPIENEAVVASAIDRCGGMEKVDIIDCSNELPGLKRVPGLTSWKIMDKSGRMWSSWEDVEAKKKEDGEEGLSKLVEGMFPPKTENEAERMPLDRCIRVYPHLQDTGGFFITVLEKKSEIRARPEGAGVPGGSKTATPAPITKVVDEINQKTENGEPLGGIKAAEELQETTNGDVPAAESSEPTPAPAKRSLEETEGEDSSSKRVKVEEERAAPPSVAERDEGVAGSVTNLSKPPRRERGQPHEEPFKYLAPDHEALESCFKFYEISDRFPRDRFMVRNASGDPAKAIYYTSALAKDILTMNEGKGMKFVHCGVKMFMKQDAQGQDICRWRIQSEGLPIIEHWVGESRTVRLYKRATLHKLLKEMFPRVANDGWKELGEVGERARDISMGCCVLRVEPSDAEDGFKERLVLPLWRSISSLNLMLPKEERKAMLLRLYNDSSELVDNSPRNKQQQEQQQNGTAAQESTEAATAEVAAAAQPETIEDNEDGGVSLSAAMDIDVAPVAVDNEVEASKQHEADTTKTTAEGEKISEDDDVVNTTV